nr:MAG TPA: hypothetical protein [Caudoviricetes sp.]
MQVCRNPRSLPDGLQRVAARFDSAPAHDRVNVTATCPTRDSQRAGGAMNGEALAP